MNENSFEEEVNVPQEAETETQVTESEGPAGSENQQSEQPETSANETGSSERTQLDKATYSFRKQLAKNKQKYESRYNDLQGQYNELLQRLERLEHPEKYQPLNRQQFQDDDSFIDALVQQRFDTMWNQRLQEAQQRYQEQAQQDREVQAYKSRQDENVKKLFKTPEAEQQYRQTIGAALQDGLGDLIDSDKEIAQYIMRSDMGPKILYEMATKPEEVQKMFDDNVTPMDRQFMIRELEGRLRNETVKPAPVIGKPGISSETKQGSIFDSDDSILQYLRTH